MSQSSLLWFTNNLRLDDNAVFKAVEDDSKLHCIYIQDPRTEHFFHLGEKQLGTHRAKFLAQTITTLDQQLATLGQCLHSIEGDYLESLTQQVQQHSIDKIVTSRHTVCCGTGRWSNTARPNRSSPPRARGIRRRWYRCGRSITPKSPKRRLSCRCRT